jgi:hypothetical protein
VREIGQVAARIADVSGLLLNANRALRFRVMSLSEFIAHTRQTLNQSSH